MKLKTPTGAQGHREVTPRAAEWALSVQFSPTWIVSWYLAGPVMDEAGWRKLAYQFAETTDYGEPTHFSVRPVHGGQFEGRDDLRITDAQA